MKGYTTAGVLLCELFFNVLLRGNPRFFHISIRKGDAHYNPKHIVVELNEEILPKTEYDSTAIADGDVVEILSFMGGG